MLFSIPVGVSLAILWLSFAGAIPEDLRDHDQDLEKFVSRPDLRPPKFTITKHNDAKISPGYWFTAPYVDLLARVPTRLYQTKQVGPHIYDNRGHLVWSGAGLFPTRSVFDFKLSQHGSPTFLLDAQPFQDVQVGGAGVIMDSSFNTRKYVHVPRGSRTTNMHEFNVLDNGRTALMFMHETRLYQDSNYTGWIIDLGFVEVDVATGKSIFEWWAADYVHPLESTVARPYGIGNKNAAWDFFHINSVDKDEHGDYLVSGRHSNTIYKISGVDGSVIWRLGGRRPSFTQQGFNFSSQHDARFRGSHGKSSKISFLNNASDGKTRTANTSAAMVVALDEEQMTASLVRKYDRPDGKSTNLRGNVQLLPNSNTFVSWSANSYMTEFTEDGEVVLAAHFTSTRFVTYRSYKFNFTGRPEEAPALSCSVYGTTVAKSSTVCHVSWNGATEVRTWKFYQQAKNSDPTFLGEAAKVGFETAMTSDGYAQAVFAQAIDADGNVLGTSPTMRTKTIYGLAFAANAPSSPVKPAKKPLHRPSSAHHEAPLTPSVEEFHLVIGQKLGDIPLHWVMVFFILIGAVGSVLIIYGFTMFRSLMHRRVREKGGYIQVGNV